MGRDYYKILGISRDADENLIKKGYRKMAMKWHPDRNPDNVSVATEKFKDINEAFEVLSDKDKKAIYDQYGEEGLKQGGGMGGPGGMGGMGGAPGGGYSNFKFSSSDPYDIFNKFFGGGGNPFGGFSGMGGMGGGQRRGGNQFFFGGDDFGDDGGNPFAQSRPSRRRQTQPKRKGEDVVHDLHLDLKDYHDGIKKRLRIQRLERQPDGRYARKSKILEFEIPPGMKEGVGVRFANEGDRGNNIIPADVVFKLRTNKHPQLERDGNNLIYKAKISLFEALTGTTLYVPTLDGRRIRVPIGKISGPNYEHTIWGQGMPIYRSRNGEKGNLIIRFEVQYPSDMEEFRRKLNKKCGSSSFRSN